MKELEGKSVGNHLSCFVSLPGFNQPARATWRTTPEQRQGLSAQHLNQEPVLSPKTKKKIQKNRKKINHTSLIPKLVQEAEREISIISSHKMLQEWGLVLTTNTGQVLIYTKVVQHFEDLSKEGPLRIAN